MNPSMVSLWFAGFLLTALPRLELADAEPCVDRAELERELRAHLPDASGALSLTVRRGTGPESDCLVVELREDDGHQLLERVFPARPADCPELPRAIAQVVERRLRALANEAPADGTSVDGSVSDAPPPVPPPTKADDAPLQLEAEAIGVVLRAEAGAALGILPLGGDARLNLEVALGRRSGPFVGVFGSLRIDPPVTIGEGAALAGTGLLGGTFGYALSVGPVDVVPVVGAGGGLTVAHGFGFARAETPVFPMGAGLALVRVETPDGLMCSVGVEVPIVQISLAQTGAPEAVDLPQLRLFATVGVRLPVIGSL